MRTTLLLPFRTLSSSSSFRPLPLRFRDCPIYPRRRTMPPPPPATLFILLICIATLLFSTAEPATDSTAELNALIHLKSTLSTPQNSNLFSTWLPTESTPCSFTGVTCNATTSSVTSIDLSNRNLTLTAQQLPLDTLCLHLPSLQTLALGFNSLSGKLPANLTTCRSLLYLDLGNNQFSGDFPDFSALTQLEQLYVNLSGFTGKFPWSSLSNTPNLQTLSVGDNVFDITPFPPELTLLSNLTSIYMSNCSISGSIPDSIGDLTKLTSIQLSSNYLSGPIPRSVTKLKSLTQLELYDNTLTGTIPAGLGTLTTLQYFDASNNSLHGDLSEVRTLTNLISLQLFENQLSGTVPPELGEFRYLTSLSLYTNNFTGELPSRLGSWTGFELIDVSSNSFTGPIPPDMCKYGKMIKLLFLQNSFSGEIPMSYANCSSLLRFRVSQNSLNGTVPAGIWGLPNAEIIDLADNSFVGQVSPDVGKAKKLGSLLVGGNKLSGSIPEEISGASGLVTVDLSNNQLAGTIPESIGEMKALETLDLDGNSLSGAIPGSLGGCARLSNLNLARNSLSGEIPASLGFLEILNALNMSRNKLSGQIPDAVGSLKLSLLDLSNNQLSGPVPVSLSIEAFKGSYVGNPGLCSPTEGNYLRPCSSSSSSRSGNGHTFILCFVLGSAILVLFGGFYAYLKIRGQRDDPNRSLKEDYSWDMKSYHVLSFTEDEILDSIKQDNLIGKGGCGNVYKVSLKDGKALAVKHIWTHCSEDTKRSLRPGTPMLSSRSRRSKEFDTEVALLSSIRHRNVVKLFCSITSEDSSLLVYEYLPNGSLWDRLHGSDKLSLDWGTRYEIAIGAARGLEYLHHGFQGPVIHRDIKSSNILLDEFLKPKIADFGLAKIVQGVNNFGKDSTQVIAGTHGYIAPEYGYTCNVNEKSDVYSFGVVLMELVTGKKPVDSEFGGNKDIVSWVSSNLKSRERVLSIVDSCVPEYLREEAIKVLKISIICTSRLPELRPTMRSVVQMLEDADPCKLVSIVVGKELPVKKGEAP